MQRELYTFRVSVQVFLQPPTSSRYTDVLRSYRKLHAVIAYPQIVCVSVEAESEQGYPPPWVAVRFDT